MGGGTDLPTAKPKSETSILAEKEPARSQIEPDPHPLAAPPEGWATQFFSDPFDICQPVRQDAMIHKSANSPRRHDLPPPANRGNSNSNRVESAFAACRPARH